MPTPLPDPLPDPSPDPLPLSPPRGLPQPLPAGLLVTMIVAVWVMWMQSAEQQPATSGYAGGVEVMVLGVPGAALLVGLAVRACGSRAALLQVLALALSLVVLPALAEPVDPPVGVWPVVLGLMTSAGMGVERAAVRRGDVLRPRVSR